MMILHQAGQYLFKVHASILGDKSESFHDMFDVNLEATTQQIDGQTEDSPILVPPLVSKMAFELFISVCYNKYVGFFVLDAISSWIALEVEPQYSRHQGRCDLPAPQPQLSVYLPGCSELCCSTVI